MRSTPTLGAGLRPAGDRWQESFTLDNAGTDAFSPVTDDYDPWDNDFSGTINKIVIRLDDHPRDSAAAHRHVCRN